MPAALTFVRVLLGLLGIFFAYFTAAAWYQVRRWRRSQSRAITWTLRLVVTLGGVAWFGIDPLAIGVLVLAMVGAAFGVYNETRARTDEHLENVMFPKE